MKEDRLTYDELLKFNDEMIKDEKEFDEELRTHINKQGFIIVGEPTFNSSEFEKIYESAREEGCGIAIFKPSNDNHIEQLNQELNVVIQKQYEKQYEEQKLPKKKKTFKKEFGYVKRKFR